MDANEVLNLTPNVMPAHVDTWLMTAKEQLRDHFGSTRIPVYDRAVRIDSTK